MTEMLRYIRSFTCNCYFHIYDHSFRYAQAQKGYEINLMRSNAKFVRICLRKQAHYRAREGEWVQLSAEPYIYVCRTLFQAQISRA
jgi:hypothetical protein